MRVFLWWTVFVLWTPFQLIAFIGLGVFMWGVTVVSSAQDREIAFPHSYIKISR